MGGPIVGPLIKIIGLQEMYRSFSVMRYQLMQVVAEHYQILFHVDIFGFKRISEFHIVLRGPSTYCSRVLYFLHILK